MRIGRRTALRGVAGAGALLAPPISPAQEKPLEAAGQPVEVTLTSVTAQTVRIAVQPIENGQPKAVPLDGVLVKEDFGKPQARMRAVAGSRAVKCGSLTVTLKGDPLSIRVEG